MIEDSVRKELASLGPEYAYVEKLLDEVEEGTITKDSLDKLVDFIKWGTFHALPPWMKISISARPSVLLILNSSGSSKKWSMHFST